ncbi:MAG: UDP-N-acetylmuramoyl-L-alanine--D-glutamate ligase [Acaryochloris sp. RU_4_1]|nr:UDP-N-acetylmuramoyl-L-alanine--D-glutamate ligase [Acaryochloris sp. RU_4_1]NJR56712.1 UDP-N-acetylmuramoyl-L-alanine--D-glutamate ligase [Acaryochloris sp. CRU_2_0]
MPTAHIIGLGRSGLAAARLLHRQGWQVSVSDTGQSQELLAHQQALAAEGISVQLGQKFSLAGLSYQGIERLDRIVVSPGVPWQLPALVEARSQGIETLGELELAWRHLRQYPWVGITGTNGKTTTTAIVAAIFAAAGLNAPACGNIGYSACELALAGKPLDWVIAEASSYQIEASSTLAPQIGVWTTFTPDHLERHGTVERYWEIKAVLLNQSHHKILNGDDPALLKGLPWRWPDAYWTSTQGQSLPMGCNSQHCPVPQIYIEEGWVKVQGEAIVLVSSLRMPGLHNQQNLLLAIAAAHLAGIDKEAISTAVSTFPGVAHRLEHICTWEGVDFINDSKATNYDAAQTGLAAVNGPVILIAGGEAKVGEDAAWLQTIQAKVAKVLLIGTAADIFSQRFAHLGYDDYEIVETMDTAVTRATQLASSLQAKSVLLSPACASFDQYQNFEKRGDHFRQLCQGLLV